MINLYACCLVIMMTSFEHSTKFLTFPLLPSDHSSSSIQPYTTVRCAVVSWSKKDQKTFGEKKQNWKLSTYNCTIPSYFFFFSRICRFHDSRGDKLIMYWKQKRGSSFKSLHILWTPARKRSICLIERWLILCCWHNLIYMRLSAWPSIAQHADIYLKHLLNNIHSSLLFILFRGSSLPASKANEAMRWKWSSPKPARKRWYLKMTYRKWIHQNSTKSRTWLS